MKTKTVMKYLLMAVVVLALGIGGQAQADNITLDLDGNAAVYSQSSFEWSGVHWDRWVFPLTGFPVTNVITVSQGDEVDARIKLDAPFTIPSSVQLTSFVLILQGDVSGDTGTSGTTSFFVGVTPGPWANGVCTTGGQLCVSANFQGPNYPAITFDHITSNFTIDTLSNQATLSSAVMIFDLVSPGHVVPAPEPASMLLLGLGLVGLAGTRRKFNK